MSFFFFSLLFFAFHFSLLSLFLFLSSLPLSLPLSLQKTPKLTPALLLVLRVLHVDRDQVLQLGPRVDRAHLAAQDPVEDPRERPRDGREQRHEEVDHVDHPRGEHEPVAGADGLRGDLGEDQDEDRGPDEAVDAARERRDQDGQKRVGDRVGDQQGAEEPVSLLSDRDEDFCVATLALRVTRRGEDLEADLVEAHDAEGHSLMEYFFFRGRGREGERERGEGAR